MELKIDDRQALLDRLSQARDVTDALFSLVDPAHLFDRPIAERHRIVFYIGHLEAFDWNLLGAYWLGAGALHAKFERLFAFGIDPVGGGLPDDEPGDWPRLDEVLAYRDTVRRTLDALLRGALPRGAGVKSWQAAAASGCEEFGVARASGDPAVLGATVLETALEHRLMHAETLAYMLHRLPLSTKRGPGLQVAHTGTEHRPGMARVPGGEIVLGNSGLAERNASAFGWDNEFGVRRSVLPDFEIDRHMVSNGEFLAFLEAGGYTERRYWSDEDWAWRQTHGIEHPAFWRRTGPAWHVRTMFGEVPLPCDWPVYVSHAEAAAYARAAGKRLPSEAQWQHAARGAPDASRNSERNADFQSWDPVPVTLFPDNRSMYGVHGQFGNGWEWTSSLFEPFEGFEAFPFYPGYSANFFDGKHYVLKGGSPRTAACMLRPGFRNWFQPHYQYAYTGFRCVGD